MPEKLKVAHICSSVFGGAGRAAYRIHTSLLKAGVDSKFISRDVNLSDSFQQCFAYKVPPLPLYKRVTRKLKRGAGFKIYQSKKEIPFQEELNAINSRIDCELASLPFSNYDVHTQRAVKEADIIHLHWVAGFLDYPSFFKKSKKPIVWTLHDMNPFQGLFHYKNDEINNSSIAGDLDKTIANIKMMAIHSSKVSLNVISPSLWLKEEAKKSQTFESHNCISIPYSLDLSVFNYSEKNEARNHFKIPLHKPVFLFVAQTLTYKRKGFDLLLEALQELRNIDFTVLALGSSRTSSDDERIIYTGEIESDATLAQYYSAADAFILPSREDNLPNVMIEALSCGCPVIAFDTGGARDHITNFKTGLLVKEISGNALGDSMRLFLENRNKFNSREIRNYAEKNFDEQTQAGKYIDVYNHIKR